MAAKKQRLLLIISLPFIDPAHPSLKCAGFFDQEAIDWFFWDFNMIWIHLWISRNFKIKCLLKKTRTCLSCTKKTRIATIPSRGPLAANMKHLFSHFCSEKSRWKIKYRKLETFLYYYTKSWRYFLSIT